MCDDPSSVVWLPENGDCKFCVRVETQEENCVCSGNYTIDESTIGIEHDDIYNKTFCLQTNSDVSQIDVEVFVRFVKAGGTAQVMAAIECDGEDPHVYCHEVTAEEDGQEFRADIGMVFP